MKLDFVMNFMSGNMTPGENALEYRRVLLMHALTLMLSVALLMVTFYHFIAENHSMGLMVALFAVVCILSLVYFRVTKDLERASALGSLALFTCLVVYTHFNEGRDYGLIWTIFFPVYVFLVMGIRRGMLYTALYYVLIFAMAYHGIGVWDGGGWNATAMFRFVVASLILTYALYSHERSNEEAQRLVEKIRSQERAAMLVYEKLSVTDPLTQLYNRRYLDEIFLRQFNSAKRHNCVFALMLIDLDYFKSYNDRYGHHRGDEALKSVAGVLKNTLRRGNDYAFRLGGEEFCCVVMADASEKLVHIGKQVLENLEALAIPHASSDVSRVVTASMGICLVDHVDFETFDTMYKVADAALYMAKEEGRNRVVVYRCEDFEDAPA